jgi:hypothetical protein
MYNKQVEFILHHQKPPARVMVGRNLVKGKEDKNSKSQISNSKAQSRRP